jgi:uncharacterized protein
MRSIRFPKLTRRRFIRLAVLGLGAYAWQIEPHWTKIVERDLPIKELPGSLEQRKLVQISDLHVGPVSSSYLIESLKRVGELRPDMVAITGDFMSCDGTEQIDEVCRVMQALPLPPLGCFAIMGNHDFGREWSESVIADSLAGRLQEMGIRPLRNQGVDAGGLRLLGFDDIWGPTFRREKVPGLIDRWNPHLVLCHNPDGVDLPIWSGFQGWTLSGHTHGGQCKPPFLPPPLLPVSNRRYTAGKFDLDNGRRLYINTGLGHLLKVRFNVRPEITVFTLRNSGS